MKHYDIIVVGGGHAGTEAAFAAARMGCKVALVTMDLSQIGVMSCNPAIGGLGKGHLVREIDALDGIMGLAADAAGIQFRLLNRRKGPAVQGPRAQADRALYRKFIQSALKSENNISLIDAEVADILIHAGRVKGVQLADGVEMLSAVVILTTGTFLGGVVHIGDRNFPAGRMGEKPSDKLAVRLRGMSLPMGRLKTGTPPRLNGKTIDWSRLETQPGDDEPALFSFMSLKPSAQQISCAITHTNSKTHDIIQKNLKRSAMYGGHISGVGPRYCPSIEDKVTRFAEKDSHQVFLEPEGLQTDTVYPNGISTSLPEDVQAEYVRSIVGLENVEIQQPGYAIEYDFIDPKSLTANLELQTLPGLYLAGQINGTTGYEEAAAQGLIAALSAAAVVKGREPINLTRQNSYIGVMIDDLTKRGVSEPYRMFTSRAEYRLILRADNADQRLTEIGYRAGCVTDHRYSQFDAKQTKINGCAEVLASLSVSPDEARVANLNVGMDGRRRNGFELLAFPDISFEDICSLDLRLNEIEPPIQKQVEIDALYAPYLERQKRDIDLIEREMEMLIPPEFDFGQANGLSIELRQKLSNSRPTTIAAAREIDGMTPSALSAVLLAVRKSQRKIS